MTMNIASQLYAIFEPQRTQTKLPVVLVRPDEKVARCFVVQT